MAIRRMFTLEIVDSDAFLDMPQSSQLLYYHLGMRADDDGFVGNPKKIIRMVGANDDDYKILVAKRFILTFESGVIVIKHWKMNNFIRPDRYKGTQYVQERQSLYIKENGSYSELDTTGIPDDNQLVTDRYTQVRVGKVRLGKDSREHNTTTADAVDVQPLFKIFYETINPTINFGNKTSRKAAEFLIRKFGLEKTLEVAKYAISVQSEKYAPTITTPYQLKEKLSALIKFKTSGAEPARKIIKA
jgi:hypothetical protein